MPYEADGRGGAAIAIVGADGAILEGILGTTELVMTVPHAHDSWVDAIDAARGIVDRGIQ